MNRVFLSLISLILVSGSNAFSSTISIGASHAGAVDQQAGVWTWGVGDLGQLGHGDTEDLRKPKLVQGLKNIRSIACGGYHSVALNLEGQVLTWGANYRGQLGHGHKDKLTRPEIIKDLKDIVAIAAASDFNLALNKEGKVFSWGAGESGELGHENFDNLTTPKMIQGLDARITQIACGGGISLALDDHDQVWIWGYMASSFAFGGPTYNLNKPVIIEDLKNIKSVYKAGVTVYALDNEGLVWIIDIATGNREIYTKNIPKEIEIETIAISSFYIGIIDKERQLWTEGRDGNTGVLGHGDISNGLSKPEVDYVGIWHPKMIESVKNVVVITTGNDSFNFLALNEKGELWGWGSNRFNLLGQGTSGKVYEPKKVEGLPLIAFDQMEWTPNNHRLFLKEFNAKVFSFLLSTKALATTFNHLPMKLKLPRPLLHIILKMAAKN